MTNDQKLPPVTQRKLRARGVGVYLRGKRTPSRQLCDDALSELMPELRGEVIEIGATRHRNYRRFATNASGYRLTNIEGEGDCDEIADVMGLPYAADSIDAILCTNVLEHVPRPWQAASELRRVLKPGGKMVVVVPLLYEVHMAPHDYYRFTAYALAELMEGLEIERLEGLGTRCAALALLLQKRVPFVPKPLSRLMGAGFYLWESCLPLRAAGPQAPNVSLLYALLARKPE